MSKAKVFLTNDRVFARVKGYPAWPACVICPKGYALYKVFFYGTYQVAIVKKENMWVFDESTKAKVGKLKIKLFCFLEAMDEIENRPEVGYLNSKSKRKYMLMKPKPIDGDNFKPKIELKEEDIAFERGIEETNDLEIEGNTGPNTLDAFDTNRKVQPVQVEIQQEMFVEGKKEDTKVQPMLIKPEPIDGDDFKPKIELKEEDVAFERGIEATMMQKMK